MPPFHNKILVQDQGQELGTVQGGWDHILLGFQFLKTEGFLLKGRVSGRQIQVQKLLLYRAEESLSLALLPPLTAESTFQSPGPHAQGEDMSTPSKNRLRVSSKSGKSVVQCLWLLPSLPASLSTYGSS